MTVAFVVAAVGDDSSLEDSWRLHVASIVGREAVRRQAPSPVGVDPNCSSSWTDLGGQKALALDRSIRERRLAQACADACGVGGSCCWCGVGDQRTGSDAWDEDKLQAEAPVEGTSLQTALKTLRWSSSDLEAFGRWAMLRKALLGWA